jgi:YVTN family beta-propeller protein
MQEIILKELQSPRMEKVYVTNNDDDNISVIDTATNMVTATVNIGSRPSGIAVTSDGTKVYATNYGSNNVSVINYSYKYCYSHGASRRQSCSFLEVHREYLNVSHNYLENTC